MALLSWKVVHGGKTPPPGQVVRPDERMSWGRTTGIGIQHVLAMFGATFVLPPIMGIPGTTAVFFSGIGTLLFLLIVRNRIPSYLGTSAAFIAPTFAVYAGGGDLHDVLFGILCTGVIFAVVGLIVNAVGEAWIHWLLPPVLTGTVVMLIGLNLAGPVARDAYWNHDQWLALVTLTVTILLLVFLRGFLRRIAILIAVVVGWVLAWVMDGLNLGHAVNSAGDTVDRISFQTFPPGSKTPLTLGDANWLGWPTFTSPHVSGTALLLFLPVVIVLIAENTGHVKAVSEMTGADLDKDLGRAFVGDGVATTIAGTFGGAGTTTYAENIGVMAATRIYSTAAYGIAAIVAILFGLCPKFGVLVGSIPAGVLGGVTIVLYGMIAVLGAKIWVSNQVDFGQTRNLVPAAAGIILGAGDITLKITDKVSLGGITMGAVVAIVVYHLFRLVKPEDEVDEVVTPTAAYFEDDAPHDEHRGGHHRADEPPAPEADTDTDDDGTQPS
jgi:uracil-xanthine permease